MPTRMKPAATVDEYISSFPAKTQGLLKQLRKTIKTAAPKAEEVISYGIAGYKYHGTLIFFAGFANHVSVYPAPRKAPAFKKELDSYKGGVGTVQFPLDKPLPLDLVKRIVAFRAQDNEEKAATKLTRTAKTKTTSSPAKKKAAPAAKNKKQTKNK